MMMFGSVARLLRCNPEDSANADGATFVTRVTAVEGAFRDMLEPCREYVCSNQAVMVQRKASKRWQKWSTQICRRGLTP